MLSCQSHYHLHPPHPSLLLLRPNPIFTTISSCLRRHNSKSPPSSSATSPKTPFPLPNAMNTLFRKKKKKSSSFYSSLLQPNTPHNSRVLPTPSHRATQMSTLLCPLYVLHGKPEDNEEEKIIMHVLEIWRKVTAEIFKEAMRKGKFGITYATNLTYRFGPFIDYVIVEAAAMKQKRFPEFSESMFNFRAKAVIQDLNVVPLIRWLKHNSVSYPKIGKLICMSRGKIESIRCVVE